MRLATYDTAVFDKYGLAAHPASYDTAGFDKLKRASGLPLLATRGVRTLPYRSS
jgi:hypothetical protein